MCLELWNKLNKPPGTALKAIGAGRLKGKSDVNPQWRIKVMTDTFGPCGIGWKYTVEKQWTERGTNDQVFAFVNVNLYVKNDGAWSDAIPGTGGSMLITKEKEGLHNSDEAFKMATTDALSVAMKMLGVAAEVYLGNWDGSKYINQEEQKAEKKEEPKTAKKEENKEDIPDKLGEEYPEFEPAKVTSEKISELQQKALVGTMKRHGVSDNDFIEHFTFKVNDTPKAMHMEVIKWIVEKGEKAA